MTKRTRKEWQQIMQAHLEFAGTTKQFCHERHIPEQTFYSRRHAMGLSTPMQAKKGVVQKPIIKKVQTGQFVKAQVAPVLSSIVLQTQHAQLSFTTQCDPVWLATLLKELAP
jgi:hypothetical protein